MSEGEAREVFLEQAEALLEGGADALLLETFTDLAELRLAYEAVSALGAPVLAYKTFVEDGEPLAGCPRAAREISSWGADLTGANCTVGPQRMVEIAGQMSAEAGPVAAFPNPASPSSSEAISASPETWTTSPNTASSSPKPARPSGGAAAPRRPRPRPLRGAQGFQCRQYYGPDEGVRREAGAIGISSVPAFAEKCGPAVTVEVDLPRGNDLSRFIEAARRLKRRERTP